MDPPVSTLSDIAGTSDSHSSFRCLKLLISTSRGLGVVLETSPVWRYSSLLKAQNLQPPRAQV